MSKEIPSAVSAMVVAGGRGIRVGAHVPKQFIRLGDTPLYQFALYSFLSAGIDDIVLVVPEEFSAEVSDKTAALTDRIQVTPGGQERKDSVAAGFAKIKRESSVVLIHDAVRPFLPVSVTRAVAAATGGAGAAIAALPVSDTIKKSENETSVSSTVDRSGLYLAQTPQGFSRELLSRIVDLYIPDGQFTDEAMAAERLGVSPRLVTGSSFCFKITTSDDLETAEALYRWLLQRRADHADWSWLRHTSSR